MRSLMRLWYHWLLFLTPFVFTAINDELFEFNKMMFVYVITAFVAVTWGVWSIRAQRVLWRNHFLLPFAAAFLLSQILSTFFSIHIPTSLFGYYSRFHGGLLSTISYLILFQAAISTLLAKDVRALVRTSLLATLGVTLYAIPEHFGLSPSCVLITGRADVSCWVQDVQNRVFATFGQPNWLAAYIIVMIPLGLWYWLTMKNERNNPSESSVLTTLLGWWPLLVVALSVTTLSFTQSRSGAIGLAVGLAAFVGAIGLNMLRQEAKTVVIISAIQKSWKQITLAALAVFLPLIWFGTLQWKGLERLLAPTPETAIETPQPQTGTQLETGGTDSGKIRLIVWDGAVKVWQRYPLLGSGVETFAYSYYQDRPREHNDISEWDFLYNKAHNEFLNFLATTGILGLGTYTAFLGAFVFSLVKNGVLNTEKNSPKPLLAACLLAASTGLAMSNFFGFSTVMVGVLFFLMPAWWILFTLPESHSAPTPKLESWEKLSTAQWVGIAVIFCLGVWGVWGTVQTWNNDRQLAMSKAALTENQGQLAYTTALELTTRAPGEALFWEQRALVMARLAVGIGQTDATTAAQLANDADVSSQTMLQMNPRHVNLWKSRVRVLLFLSTFDESFLTDAQNTLEQARVLAPTDAKLTYNLALVAETQGDTEAALRWYDATLELRPSYEDAANSRQKLLKTMQAAATSSATVNP